MAIAISTPKVSSASQVYVPGVNVPTVSDFETQLYNADLEEVFFNQDEFASKTKVLYYHSSLGVWETYADIFDDPHTSNQLPGDAEFSTLRPQIQLIESKLKHRILKQDRCLRRGRNYFVDDFESDGVGVTTVYLRLK